MTKEKVRKIFRAFNILSKQDDYSTICNCFGHYDEHNSLCNDLINSGTYRLYLECHICRKKYYEKKGK